MWQATFQRYVDQKWLLASVRERGRAMTDVLTPKEVAARIDRCMNIGPQDTREACKDLRAHDAALREQLRELRVKEAKAAQDFFDAGAIAGGQAIEIRRLTAAIGALTPKQWHILADEMAEKAEKLGWDNPKAWDENLIGAVDRLAEMEESDD